MSQEVKFNHSAATVGEALNVNLEALSKKVGPILYAMAEGNLTRSQTAEVIHRTLDTNEILLLGVQYLGVVVETGKSELGL